MIVGKIWDSEYPWDVRVQKVGKALTDAGHVVHLVCRNRQGLPTTEQVDGMAVHRMPPLAGVAARLEASTSFPFFANPRWYRLAHGTFRDANVDIILCRDLPLAPLALAVGRSLRRPVAIDIAEHYPGLLADLYNSQDFKVGNLLLRNPLLASVVERASLPRADSVLVVVEEMAERLATMGVRRERLTVVSNTPMRSRIELMGAVARHPWNPGEPLRLVYLGKIETSRGVGVVLDAIARVGSRVQVQLDVFGAGTSLAADQARAESLGIGPSVTFHGQQPYEAVLRQLPRFHAGIIPHHATDHWNYTIQNKMFDYMAARLPVIVSSMPPAARIARETGAGLVFRDRDPDSLAQILGAFPDAATQHAMGEAGRRAVLDRYNWDQDGARLVSALEDAIARHKAVPSARGAA